MACAVLVLQCKIGLLIYDRPCKSRYFRSRVKNKQNVFKYIKPVEGQFIVTNLN